MRENKLQMKTEIGVHAKGTQKDTIFYGCFSLGLQTEKTSDTSTGEG